MAEQDPGKVARAISGDQLAELPIEGLSRSRSPEAGWT
jgi:hypothetical protein